MISSPLGPDLFTSLELSETVSETASSARNRAWIGLELSRRVAVRRIP